MDEIEIFADYEILHTCKYPVFCGGNPDLEDDCGAPAIYRIYWTQEDGTPQGEMKVCQKHFDFIMEQEKKSYKQNQEPG